MSIFRALSENKL